MAKRKMPFCYKCKYEKQKKEKKPCNECILGSRKVVL